MKKKKKKIIHYNCPEGGCYDCKHCDIDKNGKIYCTLDKESNNGN